MADTSWAGEGILDRPMLYNAHVSLGVLIACLFLCWTIAIAVSGLRRTKIFWERLVLLWHITFAGLSAAIAITGWMGRSAGGYAQSFFGLFSLPPIMPKVSAYEVVWLFEWHKDLVPVFFIFLLLHLIAVVVHQMIRKDDVLSTMRLSFRKRQD